MDFCRVRDVYTRDCPHRRHTENGAGSEGVGADTTWPGVQEHVTVSEHREAAGTETLAGSSYQPELLPKRRNGHDSPNVTGWPALHSSSG